MAEALRDQLTSYSFQVCSTSLLQDAESHHWADPKPFYEVCDPPHRVSLPGSLSRLSKYQHDSNPRPPPTFLPNFGAQIFLGSNAL